MTIGNRLRNQFTIATGSIAIINVQRRIIKDQKHALRFVKPYQK